jgi:hypothetical protein
MYVCMYVCMYMYVCVYIYTPNSNQFWEQPTEMLKLRQSIISYNSDVAYLYNKTATYNNF